MTQLPIESILAVDDADSTVTGEVIGASREGRDIEGHALGAGSRTISLIGGCHADEPVGPAMLSKLVRFLSDHPPDHPLLTGYRWLLVPHVNPDGAQRNAGWRNLRRFCGIPSPLVGRHRTGDIPSAVPAGAAPPSWKVCGRSRRTRSRTRVRERVPCRGSSRARQAWLR